MCIYVYAYMHVYICAYIYINKYICIHAYMRIHMCTYTCVYVYMYINKYMALKEQQFEAEKHQIAASKCFFFSCFKGARVRGGGASNCSV